MNNDTISINAKKSKDHYQFKCNNGKRIFRKKKFRLYPLINKYDIKKATLIIEFNDKLKENNLIGLFSKIIRINNEIYLFQEEVGKRLIESNKKREGVILKINIESNSTNIFSTKGELYNQKFNFAIQDLLLKNLLQPCLIDYTVFSHFIDLSEKYFGKIFPNYFYINPITNKAEPILSGINISFKTKIKPYLFSNYNLNQNYLKYFKLDTNSKVLKLKENQTTIDSKLSIPKGLKVEIFGGQEINLINNSSIVSNSPIFFNGSNKNKIFILSKDSTGQGIHIFLEGDSTIISNVNFYNQKSFSKITKDENWTLPSALTVYGGEVIISNCNFSHLHSEDAINLFRCNYIVSKINIENTFSDGFDADFCNGKIDSCNFINCGNDAVDISGGNLLITNSYFLNIKDKSLSAGEESKMKISDCTIEKSSMGITSKDLSNVETYNTTIEDCEIAYCAFQKKGEFGPATIIASNNITKNCLKTHLIEFNSRLTLNKISITEFERNVIDYLYGNQFGKATIK